MVGDIETCATCKVHLCYVSIIQSRVGFVDAQRCGHGNGQTCEKGSIGGALAGGEQTTCSA